MSTFSQQERLQFVYALMQNSQNPLELSHDCRMNIWLRATNANNMIATNPTYVKDLVKVKPFIHQNFVQIQLDIPRMELLIDAHYREFCVRLLFNYTKRNPTQQYLQSHALIAQVVIQVISPVIDVNFSKADQYSFWLYSCVLEDVLPVGYYSLMVEPAVLTEVFQKLFYAIDRQNFACISNVTKTFFMKQFLCLF